MAASPMDPHEACVHAEIEDKLQRLHHGSSRILLRRPAPQQHPQSMRFSRTASALARTRWTLRAPTRRDARPVGYENERIDGRSRSFSRHGDDMCCQPVLIRWRNRTNLLRGLMRISLSGEGSGRMRMTQRHERRLRRIMTAIQPEFHWGTESIRFIASSGGALGVPPP